MTANKRICIACISILFLLGSTFSIPIITFVNYFKDYGQIKGNLSYFYTPINVSKVEKVNLNCDIGKIEIKYIYPPIDYVAKLNITFELSGRNLAGKQYTDLFSINWDNETSPMNFTLSFKPNIVPSEILSLIDNLLIVVYLRADTLFDISIYSQLGNVDLSIPYEVHVNNIYIKIHQSLL